MRIVVDAMGSDNCPAPDVEGSVLAAKEFGDTIILVGDETSIHTELKKHDTTGIGIEVVHAPEAILMSDKPAIVGEGKPNSSMHIGLNLVKEGKADAFVTAGNTGAALAIAMLYTLKRIQGIKRPALSTLVRLNGRMVILLDVGANADTKPEWMQQFAIMGNLYAQKVLGIATPKVGVLSNGEEEGKGSETVREANALIQKLPLSFMGNIEPHAVTNGHADVVVCDGFAGNIFLKTAESSMNLLLNLLRDEINSSVLFKLGGAILRPAFRNVYKEVDPREIGGAPLLGLNGVVIVGHGSSDARAIKNAIRQARTAASEKIVEAIRQGIGTSTA